MDGNNWRAAQGQVQMPGQVIGGEPVPAGGMEGGDWRTQLQQDSRQRIVNKIMETLKRHLPFSGQEGLQELKKIAVRFEEKIYTAATSQSDYLRKISLKMLTMETKSQNPMANPLQSNAASNSRNPQDPASQNMQSQMQNQVQQLPIPMVSNQSQVRQQLLSQNIQNNIPSTGVPNSAGLTPALPAVGGMSQGTMSNVPVQNPNMQNMTNVTTNAGGNSMGQGVPANMYANSQRQIQGRQQQVASQDSQQQSQNPQQYMYNQQLQQHLMKQKYGQGGVPQSVMQSQMQQQQQNLLQPNQLQSSQPAVMQSSLRQASASSTLQNQQSTLQQSTQSMLQQQPQSVLRQQQQQQSQQPPVLHQQQSSMSQHPMLSAQQQQQLSTQQPSTANMQQNQMVAQQNNMLDPQQQQQQQRIMGQQNNISNMQQHQTINQQNNLPNMHQQQSAGQQNNLQSMHQQQSGGQTNLSGFQQQQMAGIQHGNSSLQTNQQPVHMLQQSKVAAQQQMQQNMANMLPNQAQSSQSQPMQQQLMSQIQSQPGQLQQQLGLQQQANTLPRDMQQRIQSSGSLLQQQTTIDQQKQLLQSSRVMPEVPLNSSSQAGSATGGDWQEDIYQKIKSMHEMYYPELNEMYQRMAAKLQQHDVHLQQPKNEQLEKLRFLKLMLERLIMFLRTNKNDIQPNHKEKIVGVEKQIVNILNSNRPGKSVSSLQQGQLTQPHMHAMQPSQQQQPQMHLNEGQMNSQMQPVNIKSFMPTQQNNLTSLQHNTSNSRQNMLEGMQSGSNMDAAQGTMPSGSVPVQKPDVQNMYNATPFAPMMQGWPTNSVFPFVQSQIQGGQQQIMPQSFMPSNVHSFSGTNSKLKKKTITALKKTHAMQLPQMPSNEGQVNSQTQAMNIQNSMVMPTQQHNALSSDSSVPNSRPNIVGELQSGSNIDLGQSNVLDQMQQVATNSLQQNLVGGSQPLTRSISLQNGTTALQSKAISLQSNSNAVQPHQINPLQQMILSEQYQQSQLQQHHMQHILQQHQQEQQIMHRLMQHLVQKQQQQQQQLIQQRPQTSQNQMQQVATNSLQQNLVGGSQPLARSISSQNGLTALQSKALQSNSNAVQPHQINPLQQMFLREQNQLSQLQQLHMKHILQQHQQEQQTMHQLMQHVVQKQQQQTLQKQSAQQLIQQRPQTSQKQSEQQLIQKQPPAPQKPQQTSQKQSAQHVIQLQEQNSEMPSGQKVMLKTAFLKLVCHVLTVVLLGMLMIKIGGMFLTQSFTGSYYDA